MHLVLEIIQAVLDFLSLPFPLRRPKDRKLSQLEEAQRVIFLMMISMFLVIGSIIWLANFLGRR